MSEAALSVSWAHRWDELEAAGWEGEQLAAVARLGSVLDSFAASLVGLQAAGVKPVEALRACGVEVPAYAAPIVNSMLREPLSPPAPVSASDES